MSVTLEQMITSLGPPVTVAGGNEDVLTLARWQHGDAEAAIEPQADAVTIIVNLSNTQRVEQRANGFWRGSGPFAIGSFAVVDPELGGAFKVDGHADVLQLLLPTSALDDVARGTSVPSRFQENDAAVERCAMQALVALNDGRGHDRLFVSQLAHQLALAVIAPKGNDTARPKGGLSARSVRLLQELIHHHLTAGSASSLTLADLASEISLSVFHFAREFRKTIGMTPYDYVLLRRLVLARSLIATSSLGLDAVAQRTGFRSRAHFGAAFRKKMGVTPASFRRAVHANRREDFSRPIERADRSGPLRGPDRETSAG